MVYKKYIKKDGKLYGPYIYQSKRVDGKVISEYLGTDNNKAIQNKNKNKIFVLISIILLASILIFILFFHKPLTGKTIIEGINIQQNNSNPDLHLSLLLKEGELIPETSFLVIKSEKGIEKYQLKNVIENKDKISNGRFYVENVELEENGSGFGVKGEKVVYPTLSFKFLIKSNNLQNLSKEEDKTSKKEESDINESISNNISVNENINNSLSLIPPVLEENSSITQDYEQSLNQESEEKNKENEEKSLPLNENPVENNEESTDILKNIEGFVSNLFLALTPTGRATESSSNNFYEKEGNVSKNNNFIYHLNDGEIFELIPGSVKYNGDEVDDHVISIKQEGDVIIIETDYEINEKGFGSDYLGKTYEIPIEINNLNSSLDINDNNFEVYLEYKNQTINFLTIEKDTIPINEDSLNKSINTSLNFSEEISENLSEENLIENFSLPSLSLSEKERNLFSYNFPNESINLIKSETLNNRYIIGYTLGDYYVEYSYDINLDNNTLKSLIERDKIKWVKDLLNNLIKEENIPQPINNIKDIVNASVI